MDKDESNPRSVLQRAQQMAQELVRTQQELAELECTGSAGGGLVSVAMRGDGQVTRVVIDQAVMDEGDAAALSALMLSALNQAWDAMRTIATDRVNAAKSGVSAGLTGSIPTAVDGRLSKVPAAPYRPDRTR
ncbi:YbaB/EbfC family nucleoid-associated protein [Rugosimonospora acidiphila]|uniref:YbaB/EbfC family nucleoid-associated protein n=1 Tax=Rugosimonospora acidiphila TaxID=556531 RepID=A0ABP9SPK7_9ACTN